MRKRLRILLPLCSLLLLLAAGRGAGVPPPDTALPAIAANDVTGQPHQLRDMIDGPTLLVAITDRDAGDTMRAWFHAADGRAPDANRVSIISVGVPFFVSDSVARSKAEEQVPRRWWHATLFDSDHSMAKALGLHEDHLPYAFAVGKDGRVLASVHGTADAPDAQQVWTALKGATSP